MPSFGASDWDQLLQQSEELAFRVSCSAEGSPRRNTYELSCASQHHSGAVSLILMCYTSHAMLVDDCHERYTQDNKGVPQIQRDLQQVEQLSKNLSAKTARLDAGAEAVAATRLLAHEGLNTRRYVLTDHLMACCMPQLLLGCQRCRTESQPLSTGSC